MALSRIFLEADLDREIINVMPGKKKLHVAKSGINMTGLLFKKNLTDQMLV